jgi:hypothetical protein
MWLMSVYCVTTAIVHALGPLDALPENRALTLPALHVRMADLVAEVARQTGANPALVSFEPDTALEAAFGAQPALSTAHADRMGFAHDGALDRLVTSALGSIASTEGISS